MHFHLEYDTFPSLYPKRSTRFAEHKSIDRKIMLSRGHKKVAMSFIAIQREARHKNQYKENLAMRIGFQTKIRLSMQFNARLAKKTIQGMPGYENRIPKIQLD